MRKAKELIKAATIATALDKVTGKILGWAVKSNSSDRYYSIQTMIIDGVRAFFCDCEAHLWGHDECCHIKAVKEVLLAKADLETAAAIAEAEKIVAETPTQATPTLMGLGRWGGNALYVSISDEEMAQIKARAAMIDAAEQTFPKAKSAQVKRAPQFADMANLPLNGNQGFSLLK